MKDIIQKNQVCLMFWISFDKSVSIDDLLSFMEEHKDEYGVFACNGRFAERIGMGRVPFFELCYFAANKEVFGKV